MARKSRNRDDRPVDSEAAAAFARDRARRDEIKRLATADRPFHVKHAVPNGFSSLPQSGVKARLHMPTGPRQQGVAFAIPSMAAEIAQARQREGIATNAQLAMSDFDPDHYPLKIELVPEKAQRVNLRLLLTQTTWSAIIGRKAAEQDSTCEICRRRTARPECHEVWGYHDATQVQTLLGLRTLCALCHRCAHLGHSYFVQMQAQERGETHSRATDIFDRAMSHLMEQNGIDHETAKVYFKWALNQQRARQHIQWSLNLDWLFAWLSDPSREDIRLAWARTEAADEAARLLIGRARSERSS
ncbi:hypothetical protein BX589_101125 [Paraburkholderia fungorum]|jgi:hypothetical protein|uniref:hypothetical protein n=1 Tax=Paraburkholderia fungorum TaxID=134537 RepID=UPI000D04E1E3|nr:hypothetical protein [Paraburkholderia fungorum]PRZ56475.1 hypothetical protein BX589_101125 [Paraburkholderia fungorum]